MTSTLRGPVPYDGDERTALVERLSHHDRLLGVPRSELNWLAEHGTLRALAPGAFLARTGEPRALYQLQVLLRGRITTYVTRGGVQRKMRETRGGDFAGVLPFSRMTHSTADVVVDEPVEMLSISQEHFPELVRVCPEVTAACVHAMLDRAHALTEGELHDEKMFSLGKLAAGLAHELNNPASAALRGVESLARNERDIEVASDALVDAGLHPSQRAVLRAVRDECLTRPRDAQSPITRAEREDELTAWLEARGVDPTPAAVLADACLTPERLQALANALPQSALAPAVAWLAASLGTFTVVAEVSQALRRIHSLVGAVKGFTQMDRPLVAEPTRLADGLRHSVAILEPKARARSITIAVDLADSLPLVNAAAAELNQVWANLLDNALDAAPTSTSVTIAARVVGDWVEVRVVDHGDGIPEQVRGRIFDPFFTTKPVGQGRGLGLDTTRRIVTLIGGQIEFDSTPGHTEFRVLLPIASRR